MAANQVIREECMTVSCKACGLISKASVSVALNQKNGRELES